MSDPYGDRVTSEELAAGARYRASEAEAEVKRIRESIYARARRQHRTASDARYDGAWDSYDAAVLTADDARAEADGFGEGD